MKNAAEWTVPKWPFLLGDAGLLAAAGFFAWRAAHPLTHSEIIGCLITCAVCVVLGAVLGVLPFVLEYRATARLIEVNGLETVAGKIQHLDQVGSQIAACTSEWANAQLQAEKAAAAAREIADRMSAEVRQFGDFMQRMNDSEKSALRLEIEKLRRGEAEWLQVLVRILDHIFALHAAAEHSGQPRLAEQVAQFQSACRDAARRVGLIPFTAEPDELFNAERHQAVGLKETPPPSAMIAETVGVGFKYQGRLVRPVLVRLRDDPATAPAPETESATEKQLALETPENAPAGGK
jgi:molecular chaperone GrpE (heat shock protein)